jgi:hypothetical protein
MTTLRRKTRIAAGVMSSLWLGLTSTLVQAQPDSGAGETAALGPAQKKAAEAERLYARKDYPGALQRLEEALALTPDPRLKFDLARVQQALGHDGAALSAFERFLIEVPEAPAARRRVAVKQASSLRSKLGTVEITCDVDGAEILVDGQEQGRTPQSQSIWLSPGAHVVVVKPPAAVFGHTERIAAVAGNATRVTATLAPLLAAAAPVPTQVEVLAARIPGAVDGGRRLDPAGTPWVRRAAWIATGGAVAGLAIAGIAERSHEQSVTKFNSYSAPGTQRSACNTGQPDRGGGPCESYFDDLRGSRRLSVGALVTTGALTLAALAGFLLSSPMESQVDAPKNLALSVVVGDHEVTARWRF